MASPTLAQGVDLACSVMIFRSLKRYEGGQWTPITPAEFSNVVGRSGRAFVDLDGISVLPTFDAATRSERHSVFEALINESKGQRLLSGLARLVWHVGSQLAQKLGEKPEKLLDYVLNQRDLWDDERLFAKPQEDDEDEGEEERLEEQLADRDVVLFSLIEPLDMDVSQVASVLDEVLKNSLWSRTLARHDDPTRALERELLRSRAEWLWNRSTADQRRACFYSALGRKPGFFLYERIDDLVDALCVLQSAVATDDGDAAAVAAVSLCEQIMQEPFFAVRTLPSEWKGVLSAWVQGVGFSEILGDRKARDAQRTQTFIQDGVVFRLVWAVEAVRVQAISIKQARADELGDRSGLCLDVWSSLDSCRPAL